MKTGLGFEKIVAARIKEIDSDAIVIPSPKRFKGLVLVKAGSLDPELLVKEIERKVIEADKVIPIDAVTKARLDEMARVAAEIARNKISPNETFAVRTTRRGRHDFTSLDVNVVVGDAVRKATGASVNLKYPDKIVLVEIIGDEALISILPGSIEWHKMTPEKKSLLRLFKRISIVQMPYLGPRDAIIEMGKRIGREVQNFEVHDLVIAPMGLVDGEQLALFINSVIEGIESRYEIQKRSYHRRPHKVPVYVQDIHQVVRDRWDEVIIVFEPEGKYIADVADELSDLILKTNKRVNLLFGSREGIPLGIYRYADLVVDIAPEITLSTDYAASAGLIALATVLYNRL
ncbi:SPOUT family RNA methylase [Desulfurococcaceae archaeon MEX13E-LK6-19]|nr:SPOUT family RNA methylase [Desulfurococcaceae archaeon MEX13E-LK6-19]